MRVIVDGFEIDFSNAINAFVFDEKDCSKPTFHGAPMKAVDIIVEFPEDYLFVEIKDFHDPNDYDVPQSGQKNDNFKWLKNYLKYKYRDSFLYRYAEGKIDKPIRYVCLLTLDKAFNSVMAKYLRRELPLRKPRLNTGKPRWIHDLVTSCEVVNLEIWNTEFPKWPARKV